jgi:hypothetical protein
LPKIRNDETESITYDDLIVSPYLRPKAKNITPVNNEKNEDMSYALPEN